MSRRTRIKVCGLTREQDVDAAVAAGVDAIGFVLWAKSPRGIAAQRAAQLARRVGPFVSVVGLFVNAGRDEVEAAKDLIGLTHLQFHGDETPEFCAEWDRPVIRALRLGPQTDLVSSAALYDTRSMLLLDSDHPGYGGSGQAFDWAKVPAGFPYRIVLAGGLTADNVGLAIEQVQPSAVDVSSGVEALDEAGRPMRGVKDALRIQRFVDAVRHADQRRW